ncbi:MAG: small ribosomal subunit Rsm22 family protein [Candidatus Spyradocola sp.]|jgi:ribosomal protein RSM22 (predicted rRNA methylase)
MQMPLSLQSAVERELSDCAPQAIRAAALDLSRRYREKGKAPDGARFAHSADEVRAYAAFRMPATYAAVSRALEMGVEAGMPGAQTMTDVGSGSGSAYWAARAAFPELRRAQLLEREGEMIALAKRLAAGQAGEVEWIAADVREAAIPAADLVTASYCLGELRPEEAEPVVLRLWEAAAHALLLVEPGTPQGHARIRRYAEQLQGAGARVLAPCPAGNAACPLDGTDFCAFTVRVERSRLHRFLKEGELPYEDESFSFLIAAREAGSPPPARVLRRPRIRSGLVELSVCRDGEVRTETVPRSNPNFKRARKADPGSPWV